MMTSQDHSSLVSRVYEAGAVPELWPAVMDDISAQIGGVGGMLFGTRAHYQGAVFSEVTRGAFERFVGEGWAVRDPTLPRGVEMQHPGFITDQEMFSDEFIATNPVYEFFRREGIGYRAGTVIPNPSGDMVAFAFLRHQDNGPAPRHVVDFLDELRPHLARASMLSFRLGFERAVAQVEALQTIGLPAAVLRESGQVLVANAMFGALVPNVFQDRRHRIVITDVPADGMFEQALAPSSLALQVVRSIPIPPSDGQAPMIAHVIPMRGAAYDIFSHGSALLMVTPVDRAAVPTAEVLQGLFDLSPAEARVARGIGEAQSIDEVALALGVSRETIRSQVRAILNKTGLSRQNQLVSLLAGAGRLG